MSHVAGSLREASLNGVTYRAIADNAVTVQNIREKRERVLTRYSSFEKSIVQECYIGNLKLEMDPTEYDNVKTMNAEIGENIKFSITLADGSMYKGEGTLAEISEYDLMEGTCTLKCSAVTDFALFAG